MTPEALAALHAQSFANPRPWSAAEFASLLATQGAFLCARPAGAAASGFALARVIADEAEVLTIAVAPPARRAGLGRALMAEVVAEATARGARTIFLEVAADNAAALALYHVAGFSLAGRRRGYYTDASGAPVDALILRRATLPGQTGEAARKA